MKLLRTCVQWAALSIVLGGLASPVWAQAGGPVRPGQPVNPVFDAGCPAATEAMCRDPDYLWGTRCGELQRERSDSPCALLLGDAMRRAAARDGQQLAAVPRALNASGIDRVVVDRTPVQGRTYVPDLLSFHSRQSAAGHVASNDLAVNQYELWRNNGAQVMSCEEYVWEKFADVNEFLHATRQRRSDLRALFDIAYGAASNPASIGTRHLADPRLRGRDGRVFAQRLDGTAQWRNRFYSLQNFPGYSREFEDPTDVPGLLDSLAARSSTGAVAVQRILQARANGGARVAETWSWHKSMSDRFVRRPTEGALGLNALVGSPPPNGSISAETLGLAGVPGHRRYLDEELNEFWQMQDRARALQDAWRDANARFVGSGWTVERAGLTPSRTRPPGRPRPIDAIRAPAPNPRPGIAALGPVSLLFPDPETVVRRRILDDLIEILAVANTTGCLSGTDAPCDWSTERFARVVLEDMGGRQDYELQRCNTFSAGNLQNVLRLDVPFVDDPDYPEFACRITTGNTITALQFEQLQEDVTWCRQMQVAYAEARAADEARARVRSIPELVDPASGDFVPPGIQRSRDERMGNDRFALGYDYEVGFSSGVDAPRCQVQLRALARAKAYARVFGREIILLDARAQADTVERRVEAFARIASRNIFTPQDLFDPVLVEVGQIEPLEYNLSWSVESSRTQPIIQTTFVVVVVPLSLSAGVAGRVGAELGLSVYAEAADNDGCPKVEVGGIVRPYIGVDGYVEAAVNIVIAKFGIRGTVNIITVSLPFRPSIALVVNALTSNPDDYQLRVRARMNLELSTLSGSLSAFAKIGFCPFCYNGSREIVSWSGPRWNTSLFDQSYLVTLGDLITALGL